MTRLKARLRPLLLAVAFVFVAYAAWDLARRWDNARVAVAVPLALVSVLPLAAGALIQAFGWLRLIEHMTRVRVPRLAALRLYMDSQLARYTPGMVGLPAVRMAGADRLGITAWAAGSSVGLEMLSWTTVGAMVGFAWLALSPAPAGPGGVGTLLGRFAVPLVGACALLLLVLSYLDRARLPQFVRRSLNSAGQGPLVPVVLPVFHLAYWSSWVAHGLILNRAFGASLPAAVQGAGSYALATVGGFVALAAPAGVGVREAILSLSLAPILGTAPAIAAAVLSRAASLASDLLVWVALRHSAARVEPS